MLIQVRPVDSVLDHADVLLADPETSGDGGLRSCGRTNSANIIGCQLGEVALSTSSNGRRCRDEVPSLGSHIGMVILECASPKVGGIAARRIVARVTDEKPFRDGTNAEFISEAMCPVFVSGTTAHAEFSVPLSKSVTHVGPATIWSGALIDVAPESRDVIFKTFPHPSIVSGGDI